MKRRTKIVLGLATVACSAAGVIFFLLGPIQGRFQAAARGDAPYGLTPARPIEVRLPTPAELITRIAKSGGEVSPPEPKPQVPEKFEVVCVQKYDPPYDVVKPLWNNPVDRKFGRPEEAHFSALSSNTREELLACFTAEARKRLLAADARQGGKLLPSGPQDRHWPPDPFTRYLYRVDLRRGDKHYVLIKVRPISVKDPAPQDDPNGIHEFVMTFVETPRGWLRTFELDLDPLLQLVQTTSYDQLVAQGGAVRGKPSSR